MSNEEKEKLLQDYARYCFNGGAIDENTMEHLIEDAQNFIYPSED